MSDHLKRRDFITVTMPYGKWQNVVGIFKRHADFRSLEDVEPIEEAMRSRDERRMPSVTPEQRASLLQFVNKRVLPRDPTPPPRRRRGDRHH
jgi:hypothetical protein